MWILSFTAGQYKRTVTCLRKYALKVKKFEEELQQTHVLFKHFVKNIAHSLMLIR